MTSGWNDRISSISIEGNASVTIYQNINFGGMTVTITETTANLSNQGAYWSDFASSYVVNSFRPQPRGSRICFFDGANFTGRSFCKQPGEADANLVTSGWNDTISSISVEGDASVYIYSNINYGGGNILINQSVSDMTSVNGYWDNMTSSYNVVHSNGRP